jgi:hypothetical protein
MALAPLRAIMEHELTDTATLETLVIERQANEEDVVVGWDDADPVPCWYKRGGPQVAELAAARGVEADGLMQLELASTVVPGQRCLIRGENERGEWQRLVAITSSPDPGGDLVDVVTVLDVELNQ